MPGTASSIVVPGVVNGTAQVCHAIRVQDTDQSRRRAAMGEGDCSTREDSEAFIGLTHSPDFSPAHDILLDMADIDVSNCTFGEVQRLTGYLAPFYAKRSVGARTAIHAPGDVTFGFGRMYSSLARQEGGHSEIQVFRDMSGALRFLGILPGSDAEQALAKHLKA